MTDCTHPRSRGAKRCKSCSAKHMATDPEIQRRRREGIRRHCAKPGTILAKRETLRRTMEKVRATPEHQEMLREHGKRLARDVLTRPDVVAKTLSPETNAKRAASLSATRLRDIPHAMRDEYRVLTESKRIPAAEAKQIILDQFKRQIGARAAG
ncbi:hypothetical protein [Sphingobium indicum]|uniref:Uncharacterized protein n=1 Tax=Sphingobium indicum (strain DSM 16412 / CCM 7286 / MTCC 6364 / B90A) TaxID=861109 RepID=A0A1L5BMV3_SPHIB|nr:hypothetical protein [Sphingobium indicum]APL94118.1 hypothetical protein SIDU_06130 [Sphingobium indicum B90A]